MTLYILEWWNGYEFADRDIFWLGAYSSAKKRAAAKHRYEANKDKWPFNGLKRGDFILREEVLDKDSLSFGES